jgi:ABC-2 type transport system ATP-binding protein
MARAGTELEMIEVENLTKRYGRTTAVDGVSFRVQKGEILGFLGPNGAGKTTTMRILTCYLPPTEGTARVAGFDVFEEPLEVKRRVGYIPESPPLYPDMDVQTFLDFCAKIKGVPGKERKGKVDEAMDKARVSDRRTTLIGRLSKGYRQRVGLAQAILANPDVLILDEPTAGLDPKQIIETRELIKGLGGDHTIILSTHILPEVSMTCGRVVIINKGRVVAEGTPDELTHRLKGAAALRVEVRGAPGPAFDVLQAVAGVAAVHARGEAGGVASFEVESDSGRDVRAEIARAVVQKGLDLLGLSQAGMSLEEIFLHLTTTEAAAESGSAASAASEPPAAGQEVAS